MAVAVLLGVACTRENNSRKKHSVAVAADQVTAVSAVLKGKAILGSSAADVKIGVQYSGSADFLSSNTRTIEVSVADADNYSAVLTGLVPSTTYYYRGFIIQGDSDTYSETGSFTTKELSSFLKTLDAVDVEDKSAVLKAMLIMTDVNYTSLVYGFRWGTSSASQTSNLNGGGIADFSFSSTATGLSQESQYWYKAYVTIDGNTFFGELKSFKTGKSPVVPSAIDLGIVVGGKKVKWGLFNFGATKVGEYGDYFAWGETATKSNFTWSNYKYGYSSSGPFFKYNTKSNFGAVDNKTVLDTGASGDDVASKKFGGKWRMPTDAEWTALRNNCTWTWTSNYNGTGVAGIVVQSNVSGYTSKSIFLPAAGYRAFSGPYDAGKEGYYWSSSLVSSTPGYAYTIHFGNASASESDDERCKGFSIRPVTE